MRRYLAALIVILLSMSLASAATYSPNDIEWATAVSGTLNKGSTLTNGEYTVKAVQFTSPVHGLKDINGNIVPETDVDPSVFLEVYKNGILIKELIMNLYSEAYIDPDYEVKVSATGFTAKNAKEWVYEFYNPSATISIAIRALPKLEVTVTTDKTAYTSYSDQIIIGKVTVKNSGDAFIKNVDVNLNIGELKLRGGDAGQLHQYYYKLQKGESQSFEVILVVPELIDQKSYTLSAEAKGYDVKELEYKAALSTTSATVSPKQNYISISKAVRDRIYLRDIVPVRITVSNGGMYDAYNVYVNDSMNEYFELKTNTSLQWYFPVIKSGEWKDMTYSIKPIEASINGFTVPAAAAQFTVNSKPYSVSSKTTNVVVNGPKIVLNKTVDRPVVNISEDVTVTLSINNVGDIATRAEVKDYLPDGVTLVSGQTSIPSIFLELNTPNGTSYIIRMNREGTIELPAAVANYTGVEYRGTTRSVLSSDRPVITVVDPSKITPTPTVNPNSTGTQDSPGGSPQTPEEGAASPAETPEPTPTPITPGFGVVFAIIVLILITVYRRR